MLIDLSGTWQVKMPEASGLRGGPVSFPGVIQAQGIGRKINRRQSWQSSLHDPFWYEREEYAVGEAAADGSENTTVSAPAASGALPADAKATVPAETAAAAAADYDDLSDAVPFLPVPPLYYLGEASCERFFDVPEGGQGPYSLFVEVTKWTSEVFVDGVKKGGAVSACAPHQIPLGELSPGRHHLRILINNRCPAPYRPDAHAASDALGGSWLGMGGLIALLDEAELSARREEKRAYAAAHPVRAEIRDGNFWVNGKAEFIRATHFGGDFPLTGLPSCDPAWWAEVFATLKNWGLNAMRCHSFCPPEAAFAAADEAGIFLLIECGMWNRFAEGLPMLAVLREESRRILEAFGHHPSFLLFSSSNEPSGPWQQVLRDWVSETKAYDASLGYAGRRFYTAQSGWFYDVPPREIKGVDFVYFHRSASGPIFGGNIRGPAGWKGRNYSPSVEGCPVPVMGHELGQWCAYPDFAQLAKFRARGTYLRPKNLAIFRRRAERMGLLPLNRAMAEASVKRQLRLYKEDIEANFRTPEIKGFELLDLHDYLGQGTALVGLTDAFWETKAPLEPQLFRDFCQETVLLAAPSAYVFPAGRDILIPVSVAHYGSAVLDKREIHWQLYLGGQKQLEGFLVCPPIWPGRTTEVGTLRLDAEELEGLAGEAELRLQLGTIGNSRTLYICPAEEALPDEGFAFTETRDLSRALAALARGERVLWQPPVSDLSYDSPPSSFRNVFWNSQMGPVWGRSLGTLIRAEHPLFSCFPTDTAGGWEWEKLLDRGRALNLTGLEGAEVLVRLIDDWNRSFPLGLLWEAKVGPGSLMFCGFDLRGEEAEVRTFGRALRRYLASADFAPKGEVAAACLAQKVLPLRRMEQLGARLSLPDGVRAKQPEALFSADPHQAAGFKAESFPLVLTIDFPEPVTMTGLLYLPDQRDRLRGGHIKDYVIRGRQDGTVRTLAAGRLLNRCGESRIYFTETFTGLSLEIEVRSAYGQPAALAWEEEADGWYYRAQPQEALLQAAALHILCPDDVGQLKIYASDEPLQAADAGSKTKEIEA